MDAVVLIIKKGLYLVPGKKQKFGLIYCDGENFKKLYKSSFAKELIFEGFVSYNGETCTMRGKKVYPKDVVLVNVPDEIYEEIFVE